MKNVAFVMKNREKSSLRSVANFKSPLPCGGGWGWVNCEFVCKFREFFLQIPQKIHANSKQMQENSRFKNKNSKKWRQKC